MARIGLDRGHGKNTFPPSKGVYKNGVGYHEHDANNRVADVIKANLIRAGHTVIEAQKAGHNDVPLATRTGIYFAEDVDLIVSCHANAGVSSASGYASFYWHDDEEARKLSDFYEEEIKAQGFKLWGGSRPSMPGNVWNNFHMCREPAKRGVPSILLENGFMTNAGDFEWIFGSKKEEYAERCGTAAFNAIQRYLGEPTTKPKKPSKSTSKAKYRVRKSVNDADSQLGAYASLEGAKRVARENPGYEVYEIATGKMVYNPHVQHVSNPKPPSKAEKYIVVKNISGYYTAADAKAKKNKRTTVNKGSYFVFNKSDGMVNVSSKAGVAGTWINPKDNKKAPAAKPKKSVTQMAQEVIDGKHGNGHDARRKSLGISAAEYEKVRAEVNRLSGISSRPAKPKKSISKMADEVILGLHGQGHENRRKSLGISKAEYEKVRAEVNRRL